jgi:hypothetical protein
MDEYSRETLTDYPDYSVPGISVINQLEFPVKEARKLYRICTSFYAPQLSILRYQYLLRIRNIFIFGRWGFLIFVVLLKSDKFGYPKNFRALKN